MLLLHVKLTKNQTSHISFFHNSYSTFGRLSLIYEDNCFAPFMIPSLNGEYPELVFVSVVFFNSTNLVVMILNSSVLNILFAKLPFENPLRDLFHNAKHTERAI